MLIKPYGDTMDDGMVQLSFTLPITDSEKAKEAAKQLVLHMGFESCEIAHTAPLAEGFTMFIVYGRTEMAIDTDLIDEEKSAATEIMEFNEINDFIRKNIGRPLIIVGACTGSDAHTVGIDAIMNMKGFNHHFGLERYPMIKAHNLGAQVENKKLIEYAEKVNADAVIISQFVTQKDTHINNMTELVRLLNEKGIRRKFILIAGGPHITNKLATELGFDAGFGRGTYAEHVAAFVAKKLANHGKRKK